MDDNGLITTPSSHLVEVTLARLEAMTPTLAGLARKAAARLKGRDT
jgi:hypothetical protein